MGAGFNIWEIIAFVNRIKIEELTKEMQPKKE
jgi:hypothetical protein